MMSSNKNRFCQLSALAVWAFTSSAFANIDISTAYIGDLGNSNDATGHGAVSYGYHVGTHEITNSQYVSFLNATGSTNTHGTFNANMQSDLINGGIQQHGVSGSFTYSVKAGMGNKPVNYVSFWDSARFTNWLTSGDTEVGVYNLGGVTNPVNNTILRDATAWNSGGVAVASENEWYKAAYYQPGVVGDYWLYPTASSSITTADANYDDSVGLLTDVGTYSDAGSYYGTFDQGGNVWELTDDVSVDDSLKRGLRGGAYSNDDSFLWSSSEYDYDPTLEFDSIGFRVSSLGAIPESSAYSLISGCLALSYIITRRKGSRG